MIPTTFEAALEATNDIKERLHAELPLLPAQTEFVLWSLGVAAGCLDRKDFKHPAEDNARLFHQELVKLRKWTAIRLLELRAAFGVGGPFWELPPDLEAPVRELVLTYEGRPIGICSSCHERAPIVMGIGQTPVCAWGCGYNLVWHRNSDKEKLVIGQEQQR